MHPDLCKVHDRVTVNGAVRACFGIHQDSARGLRLDPERKGSPSPVEPECRGLHRHTFCWQNDRMLRSVPSSPAELRAEVDTIQPPFRKGWRTPFDCHLSNTHTVVDRFRVSLSESSGLVSEVEGKREYAVATRPFERLPIKRTILRAWMRVRSPGGWASDGRRQRRVFPRLQLAMTRECHDRPM